MKKVIASIVIYNHSYNDLSITLQSLYNTKFIETIVLIDNSNSDWAPKLKHRKIIYIKSDGNFGFGYGHNIAMTKYATESEYFLICNPDIAFLEAEFNKLIEFSDKHDSGLYIPKIIAQNGMNQFGARLLPTPINLFARRFSPKIAEKLDHEYLLKDFNLDKAINLPNLSGCFMLFKSKALMELGGFDERFFMYMEDVDLSRRCYKAFGATYYPLAHVTHLHEQGSYKNIHLLKAHLKSAWQYFNKWGWIYDQNRCHINNECIERIKYWEPLKK